MNNIPLIPDASPERKSFLSKKSFRFTLFLVIIIIGSSMLYWVKGANEHQSQLKPVSKTSTIITDNKNVTLSSNKTANSLLDTILYNKNLTHLINGDSSGRWPVKSAYPNAGAVLPFKRIIAFYGNLYSKRMGILGELPPQKMLEKLQGEVKSWQKADSVIEVVPALHYIVTTAQMTPGKGNKYRLRMPFKQIDSVLEIAKQIKALVFLDIQLGHSTLEEEIPALEKYLLMPTVHLGIDPEFAMKTGIVPGKAIGTLDAVHVNYASNYLADLVIKNNLPPKILVVHRFTQGMLTNYKQIKTRSEVQVVIDMDGWGDQARKVNTYVQYVYKEPVQFTGFKLFYKNDTKSRGRMLSPADLLKLKPQPVYIQYQ